MDNKYENKELCLSCGICCKKCGCDYAPSDFDDLCINSLYEKLIEENILIVSCFNFETLKNGKVIATPFLYLRARNVNRCIVDLFSLKRTCSMLTDKGCFYAIEQRPKGVLI